MIFFSVQLEFKGGTYIDQFYAKDIESACILWSKNLDAEIIYGLSPKLKDKIISEIENKDSYPLLLDERINIWILHILIGKQTLYAHFYATHEKQL